MSSVDGRILKIGYSISVIGDGKPNLEVEDCMKVGNPASSF